MVIQPPFIFTLFKCWIVMSAWEGNPQAHWEDLSHAVTSSVFNTSNQSSRCPSNSAPTEQHGPSDPALKKKSPNVNISPTNQSRGDRPLPPSLTKQHFTHRGANPNYFPHRQVVLIDRGPAAPLSRMLSQRKLAALRTFIAHELRRKSWTLALRWRRWPLFVGTSERTETAAAAFTAPSRKAIRRTLLYLLPSISSRCKEWVGPKSCPLFMASGNYSGSAVLMKRMKERC